MDKVTAQYELDLSKFRAEIDEIKSSLKGLEGTAKKSSQTTSAGFTKSAADAEKLTNAVKGQQGALNGLSSSFSKIGVLAAGAFSIGPLVQFGKEVVMASARMEGLRISFTTMLGSADRANKLLEQITTFAATTPFELTEVAEASKKLLAFGVSAEQIIPTLKNIGDVSAGIGAPVGEIAELYGKARVQGRLFAEDINQLTGRGIPIIQELAKQFGVTDGEVKALVESGKVGFPNLEKAFASMAGEGGQFFNLMENQSKSLNGVLSNFSDNIGQKMVELGDKIAPAVKTTVEFLSELLEKAEPIEEAFSEVAEVAGDAANNIEGLARTFGLLTEKTDGANFTSKALGYVFKFLLGPTKEVLRVIDFLSIAFREVSAGTVGLGHAMKALIKGDFSNIGKAFNEGYGSIIKNFEKAPETVQKTSDEVVKITEQTQQKTRGLSDKEIKQQQKDAAEKLKITRELAKQQIEAITDETARKAAELRLSAQIQIEDFKGNAIQKEAFKQSVQQQLDAELKDLAIKARIEPIEEQNTVSDSKLSQTQAVLESLQSQANAEVEINRNKNNEINKTDEELYSEKLKRIQETAAQTQEIGNLLFDFSKTLQDAELQSLEEKKTKGVLTEEEYARKVAEIKRKQAIADKAQAVFNIGLSTAQAIIAALAMLPPNPALATFSGVVGAIQLATVLAKPIPAFAKGGLVAGREQLIRVNEKGPEFVTNALATKTHKEELEAMNKGSQAYKNLIEQKYIYPALMKYNSKRGGKKEFRFDDSGLRKDIQRNRVVKLDKTTIRDIASALPVAKRRTL